jgi:hypothetical protein
MACVYKHTRLDNDIPFYIGIGKSLKRAYNFYNRTNIWKRFNNKYGCKVEIVYNDISYEEAKLKEIELIKLYGRIDITTGTLVNLTNGGEGTSGHIHSEKTKQKLSQIAKERVMTEEVKTKISNSLSGEKSYWFNKHLSDDHKLKLSNIKLGKSTSEEVKLKLKCNSPRSIRLYRISNNELITYFSMRDAETKCHISRKTIKKNYSKLGFFTKEEVINQGFIVN